MLTEPPLVTAKLTRRRAGRTDTITNTIVTFQLFSTYVTTKRILCPSLLSRTDFTRQTQSRQGNGWSRSIMVSRLRLIFVFSIERFYSSAASHCLRTDMCASPPSEIHVAIKHVTPENLPNGNFAASAS
ncbi:hypothetical protein BaRGS_00010518 [Batillaria attramentaria]|uniref:Uncharacterized protein n=1 Tax=Batillaria attramentaria TaxID=370345 RepID=A0ABD0LGL4_9CAEN